MFAGLRGALKPDTKIAWQTVLYSENLRQSTMDLIETWRKTRFHRPPYVLDADLPVLKSSSRAKDLGITGKSCDEVKEHSDYDHKKSIHFSLLPQPFNGDLLNAAVYVLTLNPGFACSDYDANYRKPRYRQALLDNIKQDQPNDVLPFFFLDPKFDRHGGYGYWFGKLKKTIAEIALCNGMAFDEARDMLGHKFAVIELFPYQSTNASGLGSLVDKLSSSKLALEFVRCHVLEKVRRDEALVIVVRQVGRWDQALSNRVDGVIRYTRGEARGASLSPNSRGGKAIIDWFCRSRTIYRC